MILQTKASTLVALLSSDCRLNEISKAANALKGQGPQTRYNSNQETPPTQNVGNDRTTLKHHIKD